MRGATSGPRAAAALAGVALFGLAFVVYVRTPFWQLLDSKYALLTSESLLERRSWDLAPYLPGLAPRTDEAPGAVDRPYQLVARRGRLLYLYPPGTPLLSLPFVAASRALGSSVVDAGGGYDARSELWAQRRAAALVTALTVALIFVAARRELPLAPALVVALAAAFGSTLWTTAARALWTHTFSILVAATALLEAQRWERGGRPRPVLLGLLITALFWVRPTNAVAAVGFAAFVALRHRRQLTPLLATGLAGLLAYVAQSLVLWGTMAPSYVKLAGGLGRARSFAGNLVRDTIDVERGLLVASPVLLVLVWSLVRHGVPRDRRPLALLAGGVAAGIAAIYVTGNYKLSGTPGPRFHTDLVPYLALLGALTWRARLEADEARPPIRWRRVAAAAALGFWIAAGVVAQLHWTERRASRRRAPEAATDVPRPRTAPERLAVWSWRDLPQVRWVAARRGAA